MYQQIRNLSYLLLKRIWLSLGEEELTVSPTPWTTVLTASLVKNPVNILNLVSLRRLTLSPGYLASVSAALRSQLYQDGHAEAVVKSSPDPWATSIDKR